MKLLWARKGLPAWKLIDDLTAPFPGGIITYAKGVALARIFHESPAATTDMAVLPGVLGCGPLRRTIQVRLGTSTLRLPGGTPIFAISRQ